jgi:hypothetical protein
MVSTNNGYSVFVSQSLCFTLWLHAASLLLIAFGSKEVW